MSYRNLAEMPDYTEPVPAKPFSIKYPVLYTTGVGIMGVVALYIVWEILKNVPYYCGLFVLNIFKINYLIWQVSDLSALIWAIGLGILLAPFIIPAILFYMGLLIIDFKTEVIDQE